jgi:hypothetical protein
LAAPLRLKFYTTQGGVKVYLIFTSKIKKLKESSVEALILSYSESLVNHKASYLQALTLLFALNGFLNKGGIK